MDGYYIFLQRVSVCPSTFFFTFFNASAGALNAAGGTGRNDGGESNQCKNLNSLFINLTEGVLLRVSYPFMLCMLMPSILSFVNASAGPLNFGGVRGEYHQ